MFQLQLSWLDPDYEYVSHVYNCLKVQFYDFNLKIANKIDGCCLFISNLLLSTSSSSDDHVKIAQKDKFTDHTNFTNCELILNFSWEAHRCYIRLS